jgi:hypothetical protein
MMITIPQIKFRSRGFSAVFVTFLLTTFLLGAVAHAASIRFLPLSEEIAERKIGLQDGSKLTSLVDINVRKRTKAYVCKFGAKPLALVALDRERPNGKPSAVEIVVPPAMKSPLVLILESPDHPSGMRTLVIEDDSGDFLWGSLRFINTTEKPLVIRYENSTKAIPSQLKPIDVVLAGEARNIGIQFFSEADPNTILYSAVWEHDPNLRKLVLITGQADPSRKELKLGIIPQDRRVKD